MDSRLNSVPLSAAHMAPKAASSYNTTSGIRAPLTVDESDFEYSVSSKSRRNSTTSSYYSGSELDESEGFVSGEDEFETASERPYVTDHDEEIQEETHFFKEYAFSRPSLVEPSVETVQRRSNSFEHGFSRASVRSPDEAFALETGGISGNAIVRPFVRNRNVYDSDDSRSLLSESGDEIVEDEDYVVNKDYSRSIVAVKNEEVLDNGPPRVVDIKIPVVQKLHIPIAQVSGDSDDDSQSNELLEDEGFSGVVRVPSIEVLHRLNSAPKVRMTEADEGDGNDSQGENMVEMDFVEDLVISNGVMDEKEHIDVEDSIQCVISADMMQDESPDVNEEASATLVVLDEEYKPILESPQNANPGHLDDDIQETDVIDDRITLVDLVCDRETTDLDEDGKSSITGLEDNLISNQGIESEKLENETDEGMTSVYQCADIKEVSTEECHQFPELPEALSESTEVDMSDSLLMTGVSSACESVFADTKLDQETQKEAENMEELLGEVENSNFHTVTEAMSAEMEREHDSTCLSDEESLVDHTNLVDGQIVMTGLYEGVDEDRRIIDSATLAAFLKAVRGAVSDGGTVKLTAVDGIDNFSLESDSARPITNGELSEREKKKLEKIQYIRVKYLALLHRLGRSPEDSIASKILHQLTFAEARFPSQASDLDSAKKAAIGLEARRKDDLDFSLCILVIGKTGVGKSATINSLFGERKTSVDAFEPGTTRVKEIIGTVDGVKVKVFDTPGLRTSSIDQSVNRKVLLQIKKLTQKTPPDVILYVERLDAQTSNLNDLCVLKSVTSCLGSSIWRKSIVALTHATSTPPDGPDGYPLSYEVFVAQRSRAVQQLISRSSGEMLMMNRGPLIPVSVVENHPLAKKNEIGETVMHNGEIWRSQLLLLCYSMKTLSEMSSVVATQNPMDNMKLFGYQIRSAALSYSLSSLLESNVHPKHSNGQSGESVVSGAEIGYSSDSDQEEDAEYDNLPPFKPLKKSQISKLSRDQSRAYFEEYGYRVKLFQKKQLKEERRRFRNSRTMKNGSWDGTYMEGVVDQEMWGPGATAVPLPDMELPPSFDGEDPSFRYRFLEPSSQILTRPVFKFQGWDHDCGYDGVLIEDKIDFASHFPAVISVQLTKDKKEFNIQLHSSVSAKHGYKGSTMAGLDIQTFGEKLAYILKGETGIKNFRKNKTAAGVSITFLGENVVSGFKVEDRIAVGKRLLLMGNAGFVRSQDDAAYGVNLDLCMREKDYPIGQDQISLGLSITRRNRGDLTCECNLKSQFSVGRNSIVNVSAGLNNRLTGQISVKTSCSDQLQIAAVAFFPIAKAIFRKIFPQSTEEFSS